MSFTKSILLRGCQFAACLFALGFAPVQADDRAQLYSFLLKDRLDAKGTLHYNKVLTYILQDVNADLGVRIVPIARAVKSFFEEKKACIFPTSFNLLRFDQSPNTQKIPFIQSLPLDTISVGLYSRKENKALTSKNDVQGKVIGHLMGTVGRQMLHGVDAIVRSVPDEEMLVRLLERGRVDAYVGHHPDTALAMERLGIKTINYKPDVVLHKTSVHIVCRDFEGVESIVSKMNARILELHKSGRLQKMLGPFAEIHSLPTE